MLTLFCLPFAGGNQYSYRCYAEKAPRFLNIVPLEYPGRGGRINEPLLTSIDHLVNDLFMQVIKWSAAGSYAIYGHSMGGVLGCFLVRKIIQMGHFVPLHLFISGTPGPSSLGKDPTRRHLLGKDEFKAELRRLNGCPPEILENRELFDFLEPILRADFQLVENFVYIETPPMDIPITVISGLAEDMDEEGISSWRKESTKTVDFHVMPGDHFFIYPCAKQVMDIITKNLAALS
jgi:surfactin synthase thioesterase subunit